MAQIKLNPTIGSPACGRLISGDGVFLAQAYSGDPGLRNALVHQVVFHCRRPLLRQKQVMLRGTLVIRIAFDRQQTVRMGL